ncbi:exocyst complex component 84B, partial [Striga asiatica]
MYLCMDDGRGEPEWFPSPVFQERFATILLIRLAETVILWFSEDQNFWDELETGERTLGPLGLQQVSIFVPFSNLFPYLSLMLFRMHQNFSDGYVIVAKKD